MLVKKRANETGYRKRMKKVQEEIGVFEASEQRLADQATAIRTNDWLSTLEIEEIKRKIADCDNSSSFNTEVTRYEISEYNLNQIYTN